MASTTVAVRLSDKLVGELQKIATARNQKVSDVVKELIASGLQPVPPPPPPAAAAELIERLDALEKLTKQAIKAAAKAQFLANMSAGFSVDVARLMTTNTQPTSEEKNAFMEQMDGWAEDFAERLINEQRGAKG